MQAAIKMGVYGPAGSGKTFTTLLMAEGLGNVTGKRVAFVDTERGTDFYCQAVKERATHPEAFDFDALHTRSLSETLSEVKKLGDEHGVIVIDSITHLWEAARLAYTGRQTKAGTIPFHAWGKIKAPYKDLMTYLLSSPKHVFICGREGNEYEQDEETEELRAVGKKMKAEGETPYEPHILVRMEGVRDKKGKKVPHAFVEKDRTGVLDGRMIRLPNYQNMCEPLLPLLGIEQAAIPSEDDVAETDGAAFEEQERLRAAASSKLLEELSAKITLASSPDKLKEVGKEITPELKKRMVPAHVTKLRELYQQREATYS